MRRVTGVRVARGRLGCNVPEIVARFIDPVSRVVLCAGPALAEDR